MNTLNISPVPWRFYTGPTRRSADPFRDEAREIVRSLAAIPGKAVLTKTSAWGQGDYSIAEITVGEWVYTHQLSGLPTGRSGLKGSAYQSLPEGWRSVAIREEVEIHLAERLARALDRMPPVEMPDLPMVYGNSRDRALGWDSWPAGPDSQCSAAEIDDA